MDEIPYFYDSIDRNAIIVRPKKPFFDWKNSTFPEDKIIDDKHENNIYLIREMDSNEQVLSWIKNNFDNIFANELNDWCTDESEWPKNRSYSMFGNWFEVEISSMVLDLEEYPVTKD